MKLLKMNKKQKKLLAELKRRLEVLKK